MSTETGTRELNAKDKSSAIPFLRSCKEETSKPISGKVTGTIPLWLQGSLVRNGPGLMEIGPDKYNHAFDGLALMHRFGIKDGEATYRNAFLRSNSYNRNMKANRIVVGEFGTAAFPDPCLSLYERVMSYFRSQEWTDNDNVNVLKIGDQFYVATETAFIHRIDPETLETKDRVNISQFLAVNVATAHPHYEEDGTVINTGSSFYSGRSKYCIIKFPPNSEKKSSFDLSSILCSIPCTSALNPSYCHSFAMSKNYCIFIEQSLTMSIPKITLALISKRAYSNSLQFRSDQLVIFHVVRKDTGQILPQKFVAKAFMLFHQINAFEEDDHLVMDMICYDDDSILKSLNVSSFEERARNPAGSIGAYDAQAQARRYILPLNSDRFNDIKEGPKEMTFPGYKASAILQSDNSILCLPQVLSEGVSFVELPRINYEKYNTQKYRYFYGLGREEKTSSTEALFKFDIETGKHLVLKEEHKSPSEPVFVPSPNSLVEDDGILLSSLLHTDDDTKVTLLIIDAKSFQEIARVEFTTTSSVPNDFHGIFIPKVPPTST